MDNVKSSAYSHRQGGRAKTAPPKLRSVEISPGANGGHSIQHNMDYGDGPYLGSPKPFIFGANEGPQLAAHLAKHLGIKGIKPKNADQKARVEAEEESGE